MPLAVSSGRGFAVDLDPPAQIAVAARIVLNGTDADAGANVFRLARRAARHADGRLVLAGRRGAVLRQHILDGPHDVLGDRRTGEPGVASGVPALAHAVTGEILREHDKGK